MEEQLVNFETAKLAKEKGFNIFTGKAWIKKEGQELFFVPTYTSVTNGIEYHAPTQSLLQKWLREAHEIFVSVDVNFNIKIYYKDELHNEIFNFNSYEEALEKGLQEGLKLIEYENKTNTN